MANQSRPKPPDGLDAEAVKEWARICKELGDRLDKTDRAIMSVYVRTWAVWNKMAVIVETDGPVVMLPNNWPGQSPEYKVMSETAKLLDKLLGSMGLTPAARGKVKAPEPPKADDSFD